MLKAHLLVLPALALAVAVSNATYAPPAPLPTPPPVIPAPPQPSPPPHPNVVPHQPEVVVPDVNGDISLPLDFFTYQQDDEPGFVVQNGFEGYIVPANLPTKTESPALSFLQRLGILAGLIKLPKFAIALFPKLSILFSGFLLLLLLGGALTTAFCAFTPFCTITFLGLGLRSDNLKSYLTPEKLTQTASFVLDSIEKYRELAKKASESSRSAKNKRR